MNKPQVDICEALLDNPAYTTEAVEIDGVPYYRMTGPGTGSFHREEGMARGDAAIANIAYAHGKAHLEAKIAEAEAECKNLAVAIDNMVETVDRYWSFDHQQHTHTWHTKMDCLDELYKIKAAARAAKGGG